MVAQFHEYTKTLSCIYFKKRILWHVKYISAELLFQKIKVNRKDPVKRRNEPDEGRKGSRTGQARERSKAEEDQLSAAGQQPCLPGGLGSVPPVGRSEEEVGLRRCLFSSDG